MILLAHDPCSARKVSSSMEVNRKFVDMRKLKANNRVWKVHRASKVSPAPPKWKSKDGGVGEKM